MREQRDIVNAVEQHADTVMRVCSLYLKGTNRDDAFQDTFLKYALFDGTFENEEHRKAWLIRVTANVCKDHLRKASANDYPLEEAAESDPDRFVGEDGNQGLRNVQSAQLLEALMKLDENYRMALYLKYYEGYTATQIAQLRGLTENTVYTHLARGRSMLKEVLTDDER